MKRRRRAWRMNQLHSCIQPMEEGECQNQDGKAEGGDFQHHLVLKIQSL